MYDLVIVGGGPAGVAAGVYAARKKMKTVLVTDAFGGQSLVSADIQNWIGEKSISGYDLAQKMEAHLRAQEIEIDDGDLATGIMVVQPYKFEVKTKNGKVFETKTVLIVSGSRRKKLNVPGEKEFEGKGVVYCSICDAPLFGGKNVAVVGGGNSGLEAVRDLLPYAKGIYLIHHGAELKGDKGTQEKVLNRPNVHVVLNAETQSIDGKTGVEGLTYKDLKTGETKKLEVQGVFVEVGLLPNSDIVKGLVDLNDHGAIKINFQTQATSREGIWAAGDVADSLYRQNNISMGDAVKAVLNIYDYLHAKNLLES